jgi:hypothetical protein
MKKNVSALKIVISGKQLLRKQNHQMMKMKQRFN